MTNKHIVVSDEDKGDDGLFLDGNLLTVRIAGGALLQKIHVPDEFIHAGDQLAYDQHEIDQHVDNEAIRATIGFAVDDVNSQWDELVRDFIPEVQS